MESPTQPTAAAPCAIAASQTSPADDRLVTIVVIQDDEFDEIADLTPEMLTEHLARWDYGDENDDAATVNGYSRLAEVERFGAQPITHDNLSYWYLLDRDLRIASLLRRPLTPLPAESEI